MVEFSYTIPLLTTFTHMKQKYLEAYMDMAVRFAQTSEATRLKVCAMIIKNHSIISIGINGTPTGWHTNVCQ